MNEELTSDLYLIKEFESKGCAFGRAIMNLSDIAKDLVVPVDDLVRVQEMALGIKKVLIRDLQKLVDRLEA